MKFLFKKSGRLLNYGAIALITPLQLLNLIIS